MAGEKPRAPRVRALALGTSAMGLALVLAGPTFAQCAPEPTQANGTTTCNGVDANGLRVTTFGTTVIVPSGATVLGAGSSAITVQVPSDTSSGAPITLSVAGRVDGTAQPGVSVLWQPAASGFGFSSPRLNLTVAAGGTVTGTNAVVVGQATSGTGNAYASIDNAGTLTGTSGIALLSTAPNFAGFSSITNRAGGVIGAISGPVGALSNAGTIDGGTRSAVDWGSTFGPVFGDITNSGTITAASTSATLRNIPSGRTVTNSGSIVNRGTGTAITADSVSITNTATGRIASAGPVAIGTNTFLVLTNTGTIDGSILTAVAPGYTTGSTVDSSAGTINGSVTFGAGNDTLVAGYNGTGLVTGVTGAINGGAGTDTVRVKIAADTTLASALALPTAFEQLSLAPAANATATLADGFSAPGALQVTGSGTVINRTTLSGTTQALFATDVLSIGAPTIVNAGTIRTTGAATGIYAVTLSTLNRFENSGTIAAASNGVSFSSQGALVNNGTITAADTGVSLFGPSFTNTGTIRSTGGTGVVLSGSYGAGWTNSGRIEGAVAGARISSSLANSGTITSAGTGVLLDSYGVLDNRAGGVVTGGTLGVGAGVSLFNATVANAGTINGNVRLVGSSNGSYNANRYFALPGSVLNGNLALGQGDTLITELANPGPGAFAGITGTVSGTNAVLRYRVRGDASAQLAVPASFASIGYDLFDNAALTLTGSGTFSQPLTLAGQGSVDLAANLVATSQPAILVTSVLNAPGETDSTANALAITSRGALSLDHGNNNTTYPYAVVALGSGDSFTNAGTIIVRDRAATIYSPINAIAGGKSVTNSGTITLDGATGISSAQAVVNSGTIAQAAGGRAATGVQGVSSLTNSGTIDVAGPAVVVNYITNAITNSGRIASSAAPAITALTYGSSYALRLDNLAGGVIAGGAGQPAIQLSGGTLTNAGAITGSVDLGFNSFGGRSFQSAGYVADGGTIAGNLRFGDGGDTLVAFDDRTGVSGTVDGGAGVDLFVHARRTSGIVTLGAPIATNFELEGVRALGADTLVTVQAAAPIASDVYLSGDGGIINTATLNGAALIGSYYADPTAANLLLASFENRGQLLGGVSGILRSFANSGTVSASPGPNPGLAVSLYNAGDLSFTNSGRIAGASSSYAVDVSSAQGSVTADNSGSIVGSFSANAYFSAYNSSPNPVTAISAALANTGTISSDQGTAAALGTEVQSGAAGSVALTNSGLIEATGESGTGAYLSLYRDDAIPGNQSLTVTNAGTIRANGGGVERTYPYGTPPVIYTDAATGLLLSSNVPATATITNTATGVIEATGPRSSAIYASETAIDLANAGTIRGSAGTVLAANDQAGVYLGRPYLAGAIQTSGATDDRVVNTGTIIGSVDLGAGSDRVENRGRIEGDVFLGAGDDTFLQQASAALVGTVDGGLGTDGLVIDATGSGAVNGDQFVNFERFSQIGQGNVAYSGNFRFDTIGVSGGTVTVAAGQTLSSNGSTTVTGTDAAETVDNNGTITGSVDLAGGNDRLVNNGAILGSVLLGNGDDQFVEGVGSRAGGSVDGGAGNDLYTVVLGGNRSGIGPHTGFERLGVEGNGALSLTLDQGFDTVSLAGTGLNLTLNGFTIGEVTGSAGNEAVSVDGDLSGVTLGAGNDQLSLGSARAVGRYDGGAGSDLLRFTATVPVTLAGSATGFEQVALASNALTVTGTLGTTGAPLSFGEGDQQLTIAPGGTVAGVIDLGAGNDSFRLSASGILNGTVAGGAGSDAAIVELAGNRTLAGGTLTGFETLGTEGSGQLSLTGTQGYDRVSSNADLTVVAGAGLTAGQVQFGSGNNRLTIAGQFTGSVDGGAGSDTIAVSGGSASASVAFGSIATVEAFGMSGGYATISGSAALGNVDMSSGRLVGLAGSTIGAAQILVRQGATFGSAGTVNGNITVAGILSPGASPGIMTVNGNVAIGNGSVSLFELTPTVSDKLVVNGSVSIASGATLQLVSSGALRPGASYDLIVASGGISGSYSTILKPDTLFGFVVQRADRIQLLGQFLDAGGFSPQVSRSIAYANRTLVAQPATSTLFAALPSLLTAGGASNPQAFAQLTPEAYASASQVGIDNALMLAGAARGPAFATTGERAHAYTFAQALGGWHRLGDDPGAGSSAARSQAYGFLGGLGFGDATWSVGAFAGYLNDRQQIDDLGTRTRADGVVAGVHGRYLTDGGFGFTASVLYDGGKARTDRVLPASAGATGRYDLHSWVSDLSVSYGLGIASDWTLRPRAGITYVRTTRDGVSEAGGSPFALTVARDRHVAGFADTGFSFGRSETSDAAFRPFVSLGARYQIEGRRTDALAGYAGGGLGLSALGAQRARVVGTASGGIAYRLPHGVDLFTTAAAQTGRDDHQETITTGLRLRF